MNQPLRLKLVVATTIIATFFISSTTFAGPNENNGVPNLAAQIAELKTLIENIPPAVNGPQWEVVYESDDLGATVQGSIEQLLEAVRSGSDIKIGTNEAKSYRTCDHVAIFTIGVDDHVSCEINTQIALVNGINPIALRPTPYRTYSWFDTYGNYGLARASIYGGSNIGQSTITDFFDIVWFARK